MERKKSSASSQSANLAYWSSSFPRQPARVLIVEALPPWWSSTCTVLCDALDNVLSLASSLDGPSRIPLLCVYAISRQQECLLPFVPVHGNLVRLHSCVEELRSLSGEGCVRGAARGTDLLRQAILDSLQQFKQYLRHTNAGNQTTANSSVEVTVVTSQLGRSVVKQLESGLRDVDLMSLKRLLVVHIYSSAECSQDSPPPEEPPAQAEDSYMLGADVDLQQVDNSVFALETVLKAWLQEQGGDREHLHLLLPSPGDNAVCVKCDMQERLISPALIALTPNLGVKTETPRDFLSANKGSANHSAAPQRLKAIKVLRPEGLCESLLYGLPLLIRPTCCWSLDWDDMENNHSLFQALCHTLRSRDLFLLLQSESTQRTTPGAPAGVYSHYILQSSSSLSLLLKPVVSRELLLPCSMAVCTQDPTPEAHKTIQACLGQLEEEFVFNPLLLNSNLYHHLRSRGLMSQPRYSYKVPAAALKNQIQPPEGAKSTGSRQPRQSQGRQLGANSKVRATVAPLPPTYSLSSSSSSVGHPPAKASRPALTLLTSSSASRGGNCRAPAPSIPTEEDDDDSMAIL